jgi:hypothetical protein
MDEPKRHVIEDIPASELPERLRGGFDPETHVTVTVIERAELRRIE